MVNNLDISDFNRKLIVIIYELEKKFIARDELVRIVLLTMLTKSNIFLIGLPGVAKSFLLTRICQCVDKYAWFYKLFNDETVEEDIIGPKKTYNDGTSEHITKGMMPESNFAFGDEVFKSRRRLVEGTLLNIVNEKEFTNGSKLQTVPLYSFFAASNEFAQQAESPFFDRLHFKYQVLDFQTNEEFNDFMDQRYDKSYFISQKISLEDIDAIQELSTEITITDEIKEIRTVLYNEFKRHRIYISPRTWGKVSQIWQVSALLNRRKEIDFSEMYFLKFICWSNYDQRRETSEIVDFTLFGRRNELESDIKTLDDKQCGIISSIKKDFQDALEYKLDFRHKDKSNEFFSLRIKMTETLNNFEKIANSLKLLIAHKNKNEEIERQISRNIFLLNYRDDVFSNELFVKVKNLLKQYNEYHPLLREWLKKCETPTDYQAALFALKYKHQ